MEAVERVEPKEVRSKKKTRNEKEKYSRNVECHPLRPPCNCRKKCSEKVNQLRRVRIWESFWAMDYNSRKSTLWKLIKRAPTSAPANSPRNWFVKYSLILESGEPVETCKTFFLATLGYAKTSSVIQELLKTPTSDINVGLDQRGKSTPSHAINEENALAINNHIKSYHPCISHYRREHAPRRLYLPHELTEKDMHSDYNITHPEQQCSYMTYTRYVTAQNIGFVKLGEEECELCMLLDQAPHELEGDTCKMDCSVCTRKALHKSNYIKAREEYCKDGREVKDGNIVRSVDLQKVVMLPRLPGVKSACFTKRIIAFHLTFSPVKNHKAHSKTTSLVWHEALAGRKCEEISSLYVKALLMDRDFESITYFMDNCSSQNKNWSIITAMVMLVNSSKRELNAKEITFKYLEAGHTFMSADTIHAGVEREMKKMKDVCDFEDFKKCVAAAGATNVVEPLCTDFKNYKGQQSLVKLSKNDRPHLSDCRQLQFRRDSKLLYFKKDHDASDFCEFDFLKVKAAISKLPDPLRNSARGIPQSKKDGLLTKLCPLMPENRRQFWSSLATNVVADLIIEDD